MKDFILDKLHTFFPSMAISTGEDMVEKGVEDGSHFTLLTDTKRILSYVHTLYLEERLIEVQIDSTTRLFFATLWDYPPTVPGKTGEEESPIIPPDYESGAYLTEMQYLALSPLDPVIGNIRIRSSAQLLLRFYTGTTAVELGTTFIKADSYLDTQLLILKFPEIGRIIPNNRPFRAKIPSHIHMDVIINAPDNGIHGIACRMIDISTMGMLIEHDGLDENIQEGDKASILIHTDNMEEIRVTCTIRHFARIRTKSGYSNVCGMQFDLESRALASQIEILFSRIQRAFLRSLSSKTAGNNIPLML
ncbi:PilZ domain-containing protein [Desulfogranum japonicum]|uniref:PilZ domain-containing protein n=1 Tax=Desulfogranum japonicum TaxID=231447 RepID=UPI0004908F94|nr:PilZ domain-containing protein [Desulfogranum japonicum]